MKDPRPCSIADSLSLVGEKYTLLVMREVLLNNVRFDQLVRNIGAPRDLLTNRLKRLVDAGVLEKVRYHERPARYEYRATPAGEELQPVLIGLMAWGDRHLRSDQPMVLHHNGHVLSPALVCTTCDEPVRHEELTAHPQSPGWTAQGPEDVKAA